MAPKKGTKRAPAPAQTAPAEKRPKEDPLLTAVVDGLEAAGDLPEACRQMLTSLARSGLSLPAGERHDLQNWAVTMVGEALEGEKQRLAAALGEEEGRLTDVEAAKGALATKVDEMQAEVTAAASAVEAREAELKAAEGAAVAGMASLAKATKADRACGASLEQTRKDKAAVEGVLADHFAPLRDGAWETGQAKVHVDALMPVARRAGLDSTLETVLPSALAKKPDDRGDFDKMAVSQFEESMWKKVGEFEATLGGAEDQLAAARERAEVAQRESDGLAASKDGCATALGEATASLEQARARLKDATSGVSAYEPQFTEAVASRDSRRTALHQFDQLNLSCFATLRDRQPKADIAPEAALAADGTATSPASKVAAADATALASPVAVGGQ